GMLSGAEAHHMLDASPIVPTTVKNDDFARSGKMSHVALDVHFRFLALCWRGQGHYPKDARADPIDDALNGASFACGVAALKHDDYPQTFMHHPALQFHEFDLQLFQLILKLLPFHLT